MKNLNFNSICIVGVGLIGASLGLDIKQKGLAKRVLGVGRTRKNLEIALHRGAIDEIIEFEQVFELKPDIVILATPIFKTAEYVAALAEGGFQNIIMDVASSKNSIFAVKPDNLVSVHPMAGSEKQGAAFAEIGLFDGQPLIIIEDATSEKFIKFAEQFWQELGAVVMRMSLELHNAVLAVVSHLPHLLSFLEGSVIETDAEHIARRVAGPGFFSFTRLGRSNPKLWAEIIMDNREKVLHYLDMYEARLKEIKQHLLQSDIDALHIDLEKLGKVLERIQ